MTVKSYWLDELQHAGPEHLDPDYVSGYDTKAGVDPAEDLSILLRFGMTAESTVVDIGAGTGTFVFAVAPLVSRVIAIDVSPAMNNHLRSEVAARELTNVEVVDGGFLSYEHTGAPADVVYSRNALHHLPDFWKAIALDRVAAFMAPGGVMQLRDLVFDFPPQEAGQRLDEWMSGAVADPRVGWTADELAEHVRCEHSTYSWLLEPMLEHCGFDIVERSFVRGAYAAYTCRRQP